MSTDPSLRKELEQELEKILNMEIQKGILRPMSKEEKKQIIKTVADELMNDPQISLTRDSLQDPKMRQTLGVACIAAANPNNKFDFKLLFKNQHELDKDELKQTIKAQLIENLKLSPDYKKASTEEERRVR
jgi:uncharacterized protein YlxP (DUF503 family)